MGAERADLQSMSSQPAVRNCWEWLQRNWAVLCDIARALRPAQFSFFVALVGAAIFLMVLQGTEILRGLAEPNPDSGHVDYYAVVFFFAALTAWALHSWFWARVLLNDSRAGIAPAHADSSKCAIAWFRLHGPRILGALPPLIVAAACFFVAPRGYTTSAPGHPRITLFLFGGLAALLALLLYVFFFLRRQSVSYTHLR